MKTIRTFSLILALALALSACSGAVTPSGEPSAEPSQSGAPVVLEHDGELTAKYTARKTETQSPDEAFFRAQYTFAAAALRYAYAHRESKGANLLLSPLSIGSALGMTALGADGETLKQMEAVLGLPAESFGKVLAAYREELESLPATQIRLANSLWMEPGLAEGVKADFLQNAVTYYQASVYARPFDGETLHVLNRWTSEKTDGMIPKLLDAFPAGAEMLLVNALCFDAKWTEPFDPEATHDESFHGEQGDTTVPMMHGSAPLYLSDANAAGFARPYADGSAWFVAMLPNDTTTLGDYLNTLDAGAFLRLKESAQTAHVNVSVPRFTDDGSFTLREMLRSMGMTDAFEAGRADFSRLCSAGLYVDEVIHKTHIEMTEAGTRAAAVTAVIMTRGVLSDIRTVTLDRPFVYAIVDGQSFLPIFIGCVTDLP